MKSAQENRDAVREANRDRKRLERERYAEDGMIQRTVLVRNKAKAFAELDEQAKIISEKYK